MKKISALIFALLFAALCSCGKDAYVPVGYKMISDKNADFRMYVPNDWTEDLSTGICSAYYSKDDKSNVSFTALELNESIIQVIHGKSGDTTGGAESTPDTAALSSSSEQTGTSAETLPSSEGITTPEEYWDYYSAQFSAAFGNMTYETKGENTIVSSIKSRKYVYTATVTGVEYKFLQTVTIKNGTVYIFTYTAKAGEYDSHLSDIDSIIGYLEIK